MNNTFAHRFPDRCFSITHTYVCIFILQLTSWKTATGPHILPVLGRCPLCRGYVYKTLARKRKLRAKISARFIEVSDLEHLRFRQALL